MATIYGPWAERRRAGPGRRLARAGTGRRGGEPRLQPRVPPGSHGPAGRLLGRGPRWPGRLLGILRRRERGGAGPQRQGRHEDMADGRGLLRGRSVDVGMAPGSPLHTALHDYSAWTTTATMGRTTDSADDVPTACRSRTGTGTGWSGEPDRHGGPRWPPPVGSGSRGWRLAGPLPGGGHHDGGVAHHEPATTASMACPRPSSNSARRSAGAGACLRWWAPGRAGVAGVGVLPVEVPPLGLGEPTGRPEALDRPVAERL